MLLPTMVCPYITGLMVNQTALQIQLGNSDKIVRDTPHSVTG